MRVRLREDVSMRQIPYRYDNLPIPGGGYVTGLLYSKQERDVLYARTDIGGCYRFDAEQQRWISLIPHVTMEDLSETFPIALAIDEERPGSLYVACGVNREQSGVLAISEDYGEHFTHEKMPVKVHGNLNGRGTGERLCLEGRRLWFASQQEGLWCSEDRGRSWRKLTAMPEEYLTFVGRVGKLLLVGTAGVTTQEASEIPMRGHSLYLSRDDGATFEKVETPENREMPGCRFNGLAAQRWCADDRYLYVTFAATGANSYVLEEGYSCDSGDSTDGHVVRYPLLQAEEGWGLGPMEDITPGSASAVTGIGQERILRGTALEYGFSGISVSGQTPGMLVATTMVKYDGDSLFLSMDYGDSWRQVLYGLTEGRMTFRAPYMRPECNGGHSLIHWLSDVKINPFDDNEAWFNTGTGVFRTRNLKESVCEFTDWCDGIEETVHLNVYSMPKGQVQVIDILGDLGGFAFEALDKPCGNSFADARGNRYVTCINADFSDEDPRRLIVTPRGNWTGQTLGGLILSEDQGRTFERLPMPFGLTEELDGALHGMERPNVNSGWVAMSPDGRNVVWSVADGIRLPVSRVIASHDGGRSFACCEVYDRNGQRKRTGCLKVFSDRMDSGTFYGFGSFSDFYVSHDGGQTYREHPLPDGFPKVDFGLIDCADKTEVRGEAGRRGVFYLAIGQGGLWKLECDWTRDEGLRGGKPGGAEIDCTRDEGQRSGKPGGAEIDWTRDEGLRSGKPGGAGNDCAQAQGRQTAKPGAPGNGLTLTRLTAPGISVFHVGLGLGAPGGDYAGEEKAIYFNGTVEGRYGFYRTLDQGKSFERLNTERQMYGEINSIDGDCRVFGRFFLATGSNGLKYGEMLSEEPGA